MKIWYNINNNLECEISFGEGSVGIKPIFSMNNKNLIRAAAVMSAVLILTSCGAQIPDQDKTEVPKSTSIVSKNVPKKNILSDNSESSSEADKKYDETVITGKNIPFTKYEKVIQAEDGNLTGNAVVKKTRKGFSGKGYVTDIKERQNWKVTFDLPSNQYYNISIKVASDKKVKNGIAINGDKISEFTTDGSKKFETLSFDNILLDKGNTDISIEVEDGNFDIDLVSIKASDEISKLNLAIKNSKLTNKNADYNAQALYNYLCENYGKKVILGQHDTVGTTAESLLINSVTGKYPAIRFGDMTMFTDKTYTSDNEIPCAVKWAKSGGIVGYMWHWDAPIGGRSCYADDTKFDLSKAVTKIDIANKSISELKKLKKKGKISAECLAIVEDIDTVSKQLGKLQDNGIAVLWRPLQEASNGYFWWGQDSKSYKWLWKLMYKRQTEYHKLNNLIWVWSAQNANWYVGNNYCDVLSVDIYNNGNKDGQVNSLIFLKNICGTKPISIGECGSFPSIQSIADQKAMWSYIGQWGGKFLMTDDGKLSEENNTSTDLITMYNNNLTITKDKLPDFTHLANEIKDNAEKQKPKTTTQVTTKKATVTKKAKSTKKKS